MYESPFISTSPWNTPIDKADTTYSDPDSIQNQQFRDTSLANTWIQYGQLRFYSSSSDLVATWTYDTLNDHGTFLSRFDQPGAHDIADSAQDELAVARLKRLGEVPTFFRRARGRPRGLWGHQRAGGWMTCSWSQGMPSSR